jgi:hypothetical protein
MECHRDKNVAMTLKGQVTLPLDRPPHTPILVHLEQMIAFDMPNLTRFSCCLPRLKRLVLKAKECCEFGIDSPNLRHFQGETWVQVPTVDLLQRPVFFIRPPYILIYGNKVPRLHNRPFVRPSLSFVHRNMLRKIFWHTLTSKCLQRIRKMPNPHWKFTVCTLTA